MPYRLDDLYSTLTDNNPSLHFFDQTPASRAIDLAAQMFPTFRPRPKVEDNAPLIQLPEIPIGVAAEADANALGTLAAAVAMLAIAGSLIVVARRPIRRSPA